VILLSRRLFIIIGSITATVVLHRAHSEWMQIILDAGTFVGVVFMALEQEK
jgi:hypothetical protein